MFDHHSQEQPSRADYSNARIGRLITALDRLLTQQVNAILHHPDFQALEARWRQLKTLTDLASPTSGVRIKLLSVTWRELSRDFVRAAEFDQSRLFGLIYSDEFDMPGGTPFGLLIGDFFIHPHPDATHPEDDLSTLEGVAAIAAASFSPFICNAHPTLLGLDDFQGLDRLPDLNTTLTPGRNPRLDRLRANLDMRFVGLTLPRVLARAPYRGNSLTRRDGFNFHEILDADGRNLLWGGAAFAFSMVIMREFIASGWFADLRGARGGGATGGLVNHLPLLSFATERHRLATQPSLEVRLTTDQEQILSQAGFIPLAPAPYTSDAVFNSNQSMHTPPRYATEVATQNARIAAMIQYVLCACRFAHYVKLIMRDSVGQLADVQTLRKRLEDWLMTYCLGNDEADEMLKARHPLRSAHVAVQPVPGRPGVFNCVVRLQPHFQVDDVSASFQLLADFNAQTQAGGGNANG